VWCSQNSRLPISSSVAAMQTSLHFGLTQRPEAQAFRGKLPPKTLLVLVDLHRYLLFGLPCLVAHNLEETSRSMRRYCISGIHWAASLCPKEGNFLQSLPDGFVRVTIRIPKLRSDLHSLPHALAGQRPPCYFISFQNASTQPKCTASTRPLPRAALVGWQTGGILVSLVFIYWSGDPTNPSLTLSGRARGFYCFS
jgi:hypothetical protein